MSVLLESLILTNLFKGWTVLFGAASLNFVHFYLILYLGAFAAISDRSRDSVSRLSPNQPSPTTVGIHCDFPEGSDSIAHQ